MDGRSELGAAGETLAERYYRRHGFHVVERNYGCDAGEIDLVLRRGGTIVFCEVKTRRTDRWGDPAEAVRYAKRAKVRRSAARWLSDRRPGSVDVRFDVVSVIVRGGRASLRHIPDAF